MQLGDFGPGCLNEQGLKGDDQIGPSAIGLFALLQHCLDAAGEALPLLRRQQMLLGINNSCSLVDLPQPVKIITRGSIGYIATA